MDLRLIFRNEEPPFLLTYLNDLGNAVSNVTNNYCSWEARHLPLQKSERVFAYELYHQFKILTQGRFDYNDMRFDGEMGKQILQPIDYCGCNFNHTQLNFTPDLVLHKGQTNNLEQNQKIIVEIKVRDVRDSEIANDIVKLNHYITNLHFQYAVFISVNTNPESLTNQLKRIFANNIGNRIDNFKRIIIFNYQNSILGVDRLYNKLID